MALWCSRLARQPVTLEVDGSSPFGVAIKKNPSIRMGSFFIPGRARTMKCHSPVDCDLPPAGRRQLLCFPAGKTQPSPFGVAIKKESIRSDGFFFYPGTGSNNEMPQSGGL